MTRHIPLLLLVVTLLGSATLGLSQTPENDATPEPPKQVRILNAHLGELPGLINADKTGPFVDLAKVKNKKKYKREKKKTIKIKH